MRRDSMVRLHVLSFIPDTRPLFAAEFSLLGAWVWPGGGGCLSPALKLGPTSPAPASGGQLGVTRPPSSAGF